MAEVTQVPGQKPRARYEWVVILAVLVGCGFLSFGLMQGRGKAQKADLMRTELAQLRSGVQLYMMVNKQNPSSLETLAKETYNLPGESPKPFLSNLQPGPEGRFVDPFGHTYAYDGQKGWVHSTSSGFEKW